VPQGIEKTREFAFCRNAQGISVENYCARLHSPIFGLMAEHIGSVQESLTESSAASGDARERLRATLAPIAPPAPAVAAAPARVRANGRRRAGG